MFYDATHASNLRDANTVDPFTIVLYSFLKLLYNMSTPRKHVRYSADENYIIGLMDPENLQALMHLLPGRTEGAARKKKLNKRQKVRCRVSAIEGES